ncbi:MAG: hypothetical protein KBC21_02225 [Candidatus Pacebacteria bacterium]|nr:hypothetical protein [Candidatus Paceibacterota bacterium]
MTSKDLSNYKVLHRGIYDGDDSVALLDLRRQNILFRKRKCPTFNQCSRIIFLERISSTVPRTNHGVALPPNSPAHETLA